MTFRSTLFSNLWFSFYFFVSFLPSFLAFFFSFLLFFFLSFFSPSFFLWCVCGGECPAFCNPYYRLFPNPPVSSSSGVCYHQWLEVHDSFQENYYYLGTLILKISFKSRRYVWHWREGSVVKNTWWSSREMEFYSLHPHLPLTSAPGDVTSSSRPCEDSHWQSTPATRKWKEILYCGDKSGHCSPQM